MLPTLIDSGNGKQTEDNESSSTYPSDEMNIPEDISLNEIVKLHLEVSEDIQYRLCTSDKNFRKCYFNYLTLHKEIISKCRGQAPIAALASAYVQFEKNKNGNFLPILDNRSQIRVQLTSISRRKCAKKSSTAEPKTATENSVLKGVESRKAKRKCQ